MLHTFRQSPCSLSSLLTNRAGLVFRLHLARLSVSPLFVAAHNGAVALILVCLLGGFAPLYAQNITQVIAPVITTVAGNGTQGYSGDNGLATSAELYSPNRVAVDSGGNLYIADAYNQSIRKVDVSGTITTVAGNGTAGYSGDGGPATSAELNLPSGVAVDKAGNLYIADYSNNRIRVVNMQPTSITIAGIAISAGSIATVAGTGTAAHNGDNGPATSAGLWDPDGVAVDRTGNIYIADYANCRIRKVDTTGIITTIAGVGPVPQGYSGDGGPSTSAELLGPTDLAVDIAGNVYIADYNNFRIRVVNMQPSSIMIAGVTISAGSIATVAGNGTPGYNGDNIAATSAELYGPISVVVDSTGNFYIGEYDNSLGNRVRKVDVSGTITTLAGNGTAGYSGDGGPATSAELWDPVGMALDSMGNLYIADYFNFRVRKVISGQGPANFGQVNLGAHSTRNVFLLIDTALTLSSVQANGDYSVLSNTCALNTPLSVDTVCALQVQFTPTKPGQRWFPLVLTDTSSNKYSFSLEGTGIGPALAFTPGIITTVAGTGKHGFNGDNIAATSAELNYPNGVMVDGAGNLYIADAGNYRIRKVDTNGTITTVAGNGATGYSGDNGPATSAEFFVAKVVMDSAGNLYFADTGNSRIRKVDANGIITTVAGNGTAGYNGDNIAAASAELNSPLDVAVDSGGNLYIADSYNQSIRKVNASGIITTVAGNGATGYSGDNGPATSAHFHDPVNVALDSAGNLYIADLYNQRIRVVNMQPSSITIAGVTIAAGSIATVAGNGTAGYSGDGGPATSAELNAPGGMAVDAAGNIYITDCNYNHIRKVDASGIITTVAGYGTNFIELPDGIDSRYIGDNGPATSGTMYLPDGVAVDSVGNLYIADTANQRVRRVAVNTSILSFGTVDVGGTSPEQTISVSDVGNSSLNFSAFTVSSNFQPDSTGSYTYCAKTTPLLPGASCTLGVDFVPTGPGKPLTGTLSVTDDALQTPQLVTLSGITTQSTPSATVSFTGVPTSAAYGATFSVDATTNASSTAVITASGACSVAGNTVSMTSGTGTCNLTATWAADANYAAASLSQSTAATKAQLTVTANNATRQYGQADPTFTGTVTGLQNGDNITATYSTNATPAGSVGSYAITPTLSDPGGKLGNYAVALNNGTLTVNQVTPTISWTSPASITYGTALSAAQLSATSSVPGSFVYTPAAGTMLNAGNQTLSATFTPIDTTDYTNAIATTTFVVNQATPVVTWLTPASITYGTAVNGTQLNAAASVPGNFIYSPSAGAVLSAGSQTLSLTFTPTDKTDYTAATATVMLAVNKATPVITWLTPPPITYGTPLSATQLYASANVSGTFIYTPPLTTVIAAGSQTLSTTFTPTDGTDYTTATATVTLTVNKATPVVTWATPAAITYGTALGGAQLNATANVPGTFTYLPAAGTMFSAGNQTLSATFTPTDGTDDTAATATVALKVNPAPLAVTANSAMRPYGGATPAFSANPVGFVNGENSSVLAGVLMCSTTAGPNSPVGAYPVACAGLSSPNYAISFVNGTLSVVPETTTLNVTISPSSIVVGQSTTVTVTLTAPDMIIPIDPSVLAPLSLSSPIISDILTNNGTCTLVPGSGPGVATCSVVLTAVEPNGRTLQANFPATSALLASTGTVGLIVTAPLESKVSCLKSDFRNVGVPGGSYLWFNSIFKIRDVNRQKVNITFFQSSVQFQYRDAGNNLVFVNQAMPDAKITIDPNVTTASTMFDAVDNVWITTVPFDLDDATFLTGIPWLVPAGGIPADIEPVTWCGTFASDTAGVEMGWRWAAAAYSSFSGDNTVLGVKPMYTDHDNPPANRDSAGTPENFKSFVIPGGRGRGGKNYTGSYSGSAEIE